jgi:hypothetical protein
MHGTGRLDRSSRYFLSPDLALESFGDKAVILLASGDRWITVNSAAADLLKAMIGMFGKRRFSLKGAVDLVVRRYSLSRELAVTELGRVFSEWNRLGILATEGPQRRTRRPR